MPISPASAGILGAAAAFLSWGLLPMYWKALGQIPALEIICHRIVWSMVLLALVLTVQRRWDSIVSLVANRRNLLLLALTSMLLAGNWFVFIWAVNDNHVVETSLGYYINPLVNVLLGFIAFRETLNRRQAMAIGLALLGVLVSVVHYGRLPWIALFLAVTFGLYGMVRKIVPVSPVPGLFFESLLLSLPAGGLLLHLHFQGSGGLGSAGPGLDILLLGAGVVTTAPLLCFAFAVRRLRLVTVGVMQYIAPTGMFLLGVFRYGEEFGLARLITFCCIWAGVAVYVLDGLRLHRQESRLLHRKGDETPSRG